MDEVLTYLHDISVTIFTSSKPLNFYSLTFIPTYLGEMLQDIALTINSVQSSSNYKLFITLLMPALYVIGSEIIVDALKHAFITKFNDIPASIYSRYTLSLFRDMTGTTKERPKTESDWHKGEPYSQEGSMVSTVLQPFHAKSKCEKAR